jgi:hypothetical protein
VEAVATGTFEIAVGRARYRGPSAELRPHVRRLRRAADPIISTPLSPRLGISRRLEIVRDAPASRNATLVGTARHGKDDVTLGRLLADTPMVVGALADWASDEGPATVRPDPPTH